MWYCHGTRIEKPSTNITWSWRRWTMRFEDVRVQSRFMMEDFSTLFTYVIATRFMFAGDMNLSSNQWNLLLQPNFFGKLAKPVSNITWTYNLPTTLMDYKNFGHIVNLSLPHPPLLLFFLPSSPSTHWACLLQLFCLHQSLFLLTIHFFLIRILQIFWVFSYLMS